MWLPSSQSCEQQAQRATEKGQLHASLAQAAGRSACLSKPWRSGQELSAIVKLDEEW